MRRQTKQFHLHATFRYITSCDFHSCVHSKSQYSLSCIWTRSGPTLWGLLPILPRRLNLPASRVSCGELSLYWTSNIAIGLSFSSKGSITAQTRHDQLGIPFQEILGRIKPAFLYSLWIYSYHFGNISSIISCVCI